MLGKHQQLRKIFTNITVILSRKNYGGCLAPTSFSCLLLVQEFWIDKLFLLKGFLKQGVSIAKGSLIMRRLFLFLIRSE